MLPRPLVLTLLSCTLLASRATALPELYGLFSAAGTLGTINTATGTVTNVTPLGVSLMTGAARDPGTGTVYGWANLQGLFTIDVATGATTFVNPSTPPGLQLGNISFASDGNLYAFGGGAADVYQIDLTTGALTAVVSNFLPHMGGADLSPTGELFATTSTGQLYRNLDPLTGSFDNIVTLELSDGSALDSIVLSIAFSPSGSLVGSAFRHPQFHEYQYNATLDRWELNGAAPGFAASGETTNGITYTFDAAGNTTSAVDGGGGPFPFPNVSPPWSAITDTVAFEAHREVLFDIDSLTGTVSNLRDFSSGVPGGMFFAVGMFFVPEPAIPVPAISPVGRIALTALMLGLGLAGMRVRSVPKSR